MTVKQNKDLVRRLYDTLNEGPDAMEAARAEIFAPDARSHFSRQTFDYAAHAQFDATMATAFPDRRYTVEDMLADGDKVAVRFSTFGTHLGPLEGIPPTGKSGFVTGMAICRIAGGQIVEQWVEYDQLGLLQELGIIPRMESASV